MDNKEVLFNIAKDLDLFWSYSKDITSENMPDEILIEKILAYGDIDALILLFKTYPYNILYKVWERELIPDGRFEPANYFLAKFFFNTNINNIKVETRINRLIKIMNKERG
ncbi:MAG: hypothetical protein M1483_01640 [Actinobacteria bacterium]|jgi:hypothetical protein|nr:hypothetical protein [Actinomycetota bacterium]MCL6104333.1 hypothetical protein [Actinomycetota bacterium]